MGEPRADAFSASDTNDFYELATRLRGGTDFILPNYELNVRALA